MVTRLANILGGLAGDKEMGAANPMMGAVLQMMTGWISATADDEIEKAVRLIYAMLDIVMKDDDAVAA